MPPVQVQSEYWNPALGRRLEFASSNDCSYWELLHYPDLPTLQLSEGKLDETSLASWFVKDLSLPYSSHNKRQKPSSGIRLLIGICDVDPEMNSPVVSLTRDSYAIIEKELGLPAIFLNHMTSNLIRTSIFSTSRKNTKSLTGLVFKLPFYRPIFYQVALVYNSQTNLTHGLLIAKRECDVIPQLLSHMRAYESYGCEQPSLLFAAASEMMIDVAVQRLHKHEGKINDLEEIIGQHEYDNRPRGNPLELDFMSTTRSINHVTKRLAVDVCVLEAMLLVLERILEWQLEIKKIKCEGNKQSLNLVPGETYKWLSIVDEKVAYLKDTCHHQLSGAKYQEKRISALTQVVYQFMAQKDAQANIELARTSAILAEASKKDSEVMASIAVETQKDSFAMKTIAVLGMFFLPGTFVAALFAMPVFNWDGNGMPAIKAGFKYYWLVTGPLTVVVLMSWGLAMLLPWRIWATKIWPKSNLV